eukprot:gene6206-8548_t
MLEDVIQESARKLCCYTKSTIVAKSSSESILLFNPSEWVDKIDRKLAHSLCGEYNTIALTLKCIPVLNESTSNLSDSFLSVLCDIIGPKLVEINIQDCPYLTWNQLKLILSKTKSIERISLQSLSWIDDNIIEQISIRYQKSLTQLKLENLKNISNNSLHQIGRRCFNLKNLELICCPQIGDTGMMELTKKISIHSLKLAHISNITDKSIEMLISNATNVGSIVINDCSKLTDKSIISIYESIKSWGKSRNTETINLTHLELQNNPNFTAQILTFLSAAIPNVTSIDLRGCNNINYDKGLTEIKDLKYIQNIKIGPMKQKYRLNQDTFISNMLGFAPNLIILHLNGIKDCTDDMIGQILEYCLELDELLLEDIEFGRLTIESICSNIPNISTLSLCGSSIFKDVELRCLATICLNLKSLTIKYCNQLTDGGFARFVNAKSLTHLDLSSCSTKCEDTYLKFFTLSPLQSLIIDNTTINPGLVFTSLASRTKFELHTISLRNSKSNLKPEDIIFVLNNWIHCTNLDITGCGIHNSILRSMQHFNPFLSFHSDYSKEYTGFSLDVPMRMKYHQYYQNRIGFRRRYAARIFQRCYHKYKKRLQELKELRRVKWKNFKLMQVIKIQAHIRRFIMKRQFQRKLTAGRLIVDFARDYLNRIQNSKFSTANSYYIQHMKRSTFLSIKRFSKKSKQNDKRNFLLLQQINSKFCLKKHFMILKQEESTFRDENFGNKSVVLWEINICKKILKRWKTVIFESSKHKQLLVKIFMNCISINSHNSIRQMALKNMAKQFHNQSLILPVWLQFGKDVVERRRLDSLVPIAIKHYEYTFFNRFVGKIYNAFALHRINKIYKRNALVKGIYGYKINYLKRAMEKVTLRIAYCKKERNQIKLYLHIRNDFLKKYMMKKYFPEYMQRTFYFKSQRDKAIEKENKWKVKTGFNDLKLGVIRMRIWRRMNAIALRKRKEIYQRNTWRAWDEFRIYNKNLGDLYFKRYQTKMTRRAFDGLKKFVTISKDQNQYFLDELYKRSGSKEAFERNFESFLIFQAKCRGYIIFTKFQLVKIEKLSAIQTIQNFMRRIQAKKRYRSEYRKRNIKEIKNEERELDLMRESELETRYFNFHLKAIIDIQRTYRGWKGRIIGALAAVEFHRYKSIEYYKENEHIKAVHDNFLRAQAAREVQRGKSAVQIQKIVRGMLSRMKFVGIKHQAKMNKYAVFVQRDYRRRLAKLKLEALRRDKVSDIRFKAARKHRGFLLRLFGLNTRQFQANFSVILDALGIDPITYHYQIPELIKETLSDFEHLRNIFAREKMIFEIHGLKKIPGMMKRREVVTNQGWGLDVHDSVRIIEPGHKYFGHTGIISRIDESLIGQPLFEIKLDRLPHSARAPVVTFLKMSTDPLTIYLNTQPVVEVAQRPKLDIFKQPFRIYGLEADEGGIDLYSHNEESEEFDENGDPIPRTKAVNNKVVLSLHAKSNESKVASLKQKITAVWKIQCAYRIHRAKIITARKRYEVWVQSIDRHYSLMNHLADTNTFTFQGNIVTKMLGVHHRKMIFYDEIRHSIVPRRMDKITTKSNEKTEIMREFEHRYRDRMKYLQKSALLKGKEYFADGFQRMTFTRKFGLLVQRACGVSMKNKRKGGTAMRDVLGSRGIQMIAKNKSLVKGLDMFSFERFHGSPHVRYYKTSLYQGEWSGLPLFTKLVPHGEGLITFLDAWGFTKENKVLYLKIIRCRELSAMDLFSSDPYCDIICNGSSLQTTVKWTNLNPEYHESFEIDVTNPAATLNIVVKDRDYFGADDFMGQVMLKLGDYDDGKVHTLKLPLSGEDLTIKNEEYDRGEIEFELRWAERVYADDQARIDRKKLMLVRLQSWTRKVIAQNYLKKLRKEREDLMEFIRGKAIKITNTCRIRLARIEVKRLTRDIKAAIRIQKRIRIRIAKRIFRLKLLRHKKAIIIQTRMRVCLAKAFVKRMRGDIADNLDEHATVIQKHARRMVVRMRVAKIKEEEEIQRKELAAAKIRENDDESVSLASAVIRIPFSEWILTYGVDPEYGLKRNRRITERIFQKMLRTKHVRLLTWKYGIVYVNCYPPPKSEEEAAGAIEPDKFNVREDFVSAFLPPFRPVSFHRVKAIELNSKYCHLGSFHIETSIDMRGSVDFTVITIQCMVRQRKARRQYLFMLRIHRAFSLFQKIFRKRYEKLHNASRRIITLFKLAKSKKLVNFLRLERNSAMIIQNSYRCYRARSLLFDSRCVKKLAVLKCTTPHVAFHGPEKCLEHRSDTFWIAESHEECELRVEFSKVECIVEVWVMTSTFNTSPRFVTIGALLNKKEGKYEELIDRQLLPRLKENRWHKFSFPMLLTKYFKVTFQDNYGDDKYISVRQIRFLRCKEKSITITKQPIHHVLEDGPTIGDTRKIKLSIAADGWPIPTYQWYHNNKKIKGGTSKELIVQLGCETSGERSYRCIRCKMMAQSVPYNAYLIKCGNCGNLFAYKEIEAYDKAIAKIKVQEADALKEETTLLTNKAQMELFDNPKYAPLIHDMNVRLEELQIILQVLREKRVSVKDKVSTCNRFTGEGIYVCRVHNVRGGSLKLTKKSIPAVVLVEHSMPYVVQVIPLYFPRQQTSRKRWSIYSSILGSFSEGNLVGLVQIRFVDGSFYEGPYISEDAINLKGEVIDGMRPKNHYGVFKLPDGRIFEGHNVDNHFDPANLQTYYKVTFPNKETYCGMFCDEMFHGIGIYTYADGSVYEGNWHRGTCFGHGHFRSHEGWTYEGFYDTNRRHRNGVISWPDGSCYMGEWFYEKIQGHGIYITTLRDVYKGQIVDGKYDGHGELIYSDGSRYVGEFQHGLRYGRGIFSEREGNEYYGNYVNDVRHGEHVVKCIIQIEEHDQDNYEVRIAVFEHGVLVKWKSKFSNPIATKHFINLFKANRDMFDSVYSMIIAKNLPNTPEGIDANNPQVKNIIFKIRNEAGMLVGKQAMLQAQAQIDFLLKPTIEKRNEVDHLKKEIEHLSLLIIGEEQGSFHYDIKYKSLMEIYEKDTAKIEQFWFDEPTEIRARFQAACKKLDTITVEEYFSFRNYRILPVFVKKIFDAISLLLNIPNDWKNLQFIIADSVANTRNGDEEAVRFDYKCKLSHLMKSYYVYDYIDNIKNNMELEKILSDVRFRSD